MRPYSLDLRQKIIDTYEQESISQRELAKRFGVALSFIEKLLKQRRETGSIAPKPRYQPSRSKLNAEHIGILRQLVQKYPDMTLTELVNRFEAATGIRVALSTMSRTLKTHKITPRRNVSRYCQQA